MEKQKLCLRCMRKIGDSNVCPYCKNEPDEDASLPRLPLKTVVGGRYFVGKLVHFGADSLLYYAYDLQDKVPVTLCEFFPRDIVSRGQDNYCLINVGKASAFVNTKDDFIELWNKLSEIKGHSALYNVRDVFEDFGTVYAVSDFSGDSKTLREYLLANEQGYISWEEARVLLMPALSALNTLHGAGIIHGGISPETLLVDPRGKLKISGFGIFESRSAGGALTPELYDGYAAVEQYNADGKTGRWTDIYSFAAVLYRVLIGSKPMSAQSRVINDKLMIPGRFAEQLPAYVINALVNALQVMPFDRTGDIERLRDELSASPAAAGIASEAYEDEGAYIEMPEEIEEDDVDEDYEENTGSHKKSTVVAFVISAVLCLAILAGVLIGINHYKNRSDDDPSTSEESSAEESLSSEESDVSETGNVTVVLPKFVGKNYDDVKDDETYKNVLSFKTEFVDNKEYPIGTILSQDRSEGTVVTSENPCTIFFKISNGIKVPDLRDRKLQEVLEELEEAGFTNVEATAGKKAEYGAKSLTVYNITLEDAESLPGDRRVSYNDKIYVYYYAEISVPTSSYETEATTQPETSAPAETETEKADIVDSIIENFNN